MTGTIGDLILATLIFVGGHFVLSSTPLRGAIAGRIGEYPFMGLFSALSVAVLMWMIRAYGEAPFVEIWVMAGWMRWLPVALMLVASVLVVASVTTPNPTAAGMPVSFAAAGPKGIIKVTRHPMMWGAGLWALSHMLPNGDLASLIFFGGMAVLALWGTVLIDAKKKDRLGPHWETLAAQSSNLPFAAVIEGRVTVSMNEIGWWRVALGIILYAALLHFHEAVIGSAVLP